MLKGKDLIGVAVVGRDGAQLGKVRDVIYDHDAGQALALVLGERDLFGLIDALVVPWPEVESIGRDVIFARSAASKVKLSDDEVARKAAQRETSLSGTRIMTADGTQLGTLADMILDPTTGRVLGYELSGGFVSDTLHGKKFLPSPPGLSIGQDAAVVPPGTAPQKAPETSR